MATTIVVDPTLDAVLTKLARAGVKHPTTLTRAFVNVPILITFTLGADGDTPTATLAPTDSHVWAFRDEPTKTFDDREIS